MGKRTTKVGTVPPVDDLSLDEFDPALEDFTEPALGTAEVTEAVAGEEAQLRADIEKTRAGMSSTIDALQEKLAPERIMEQVKEKVQEHAAEAIDAAKHAVREATIGKAEHFMHNVNETVSDASRTVGRVVEESSILRIRNNPFPFALIAAGRGMLAMNRRSERPGYRASDRDDRGGYRADYGDDRGYRGYEGGADRWKENQPGYLYTAKEAVSNVADRTKEAVSSATGTIRDTAATVAERTRGQVEHICEQAEWGARRAGDTFETVLRDYPLAVGVAALAAGAAVGLAMPSTRVEREYMGEARDQFVEKAQTVAKDTVEKVQRVAHEAGRAVQEEAQHQGLTTSI